MATIASGLERADVDGLAATIRGEVIRPGDEAYDAARRVWNGMIDRRPALIVRCAGVGDVIDCVRFARERELLTAVRGGGHNVGGFGTCDGGIVIDLSRLKGIRVDPKARRVRAEAGVTQGELDHETQAFGLATTGGLVSTTGIAGLTLGGGYGWLGRKHGLTCDNLVSADLVTAGGSVLTASADENDDLFWGLRGGGGNFGVVTSFEYGLHPVGPMVLGGAVFYPIERAGEFLRFFREWTPTLPDELATAVALLDAPTAPFVPEKLQGTPMIAMALCYAGPPEQGERAIRGLRAFGPPAIDLSGPISYTAQQAMFDAFYPHGSLSYWKSEQLAELGDEAIETLLEQFARKSSPLSQVFVEALGGAVPRAVGGETAFSHRDAAYRVLVFGLWAEHSEADVHIEWVRSIWRAIQPCSTGGVYLNFLGEEGEDRVRAAYESEKYARLAALKAAYDPSNLFRLNQNIRPV